MEFYLNAISLWVTHSENNKNKTSNRGVEYVFINDIDEYLIVVEDYYDDETNDKFYFWNGMQYRELHIIENRRGFRFVCMRDANGSRVNVSISKFKKLSGLN